MKCWSRTHGFDGRTVKTGGGSEVSGDSWASLCCPCLIRAAGIGWQREAHRPQRSSPAACPTRLWLTVKHTVDVLWYLQSAFGLTRVDLLQGDVLLQQPAEFDLRAVLPTGAVVSQDEVGVAVVEHSQLAQGVCHRLIGFICLEKERDIRMTCFKKKNPLFFWRLRAEHILTSFPMRSSLFSRIPHGAIPIAHTFPRDLEEWSFKASPTWRITPKMWREKHSSMNNDSCGCIMGQGDVTAGRIHTIVISDEFSKQNL